MPSNVTRVSGRPKLDSKVGLWDRGNPQLHLPSPIHPWQTPFSLSQVAATSETESVLVGTYIRNCQDWTANESVRRASPKRNLPGSGALQSASHLHASQGKSALGRSLAKKGMAAN